MSFGTDGEGVKGVVGESLSSRVPTLQVVYPMPEGKHNMDATK